MSEDNKTASSTLYKTVYLNSGYEFELNILIGYGQPSFTSILLGNDVLVNNDPSSEFAILKSSQELDGKKLICTTTVHDEREETNQTSAKYSWKYNGNEDSRLLSEPVPEDGGIVLYSATFRFKVR